MVTLADEHPVRGKSFFSLHTAFEEQYTELFAAVDEIAERIRAKGALATPDTKDACSQFCEVMQNEDHGWISRVKGMSAHWLLRDQQQDSYTRHLEQPDARTLYVHWDFQDSCPRVCASNREG